MALKGKILNSENIKNYQNNFGEDIQLSIYYKPNHNHIL